MKTKILFLLMIVSIIFSSCSNSNKVVSSGFIQKRKYTKGYHLDLFSANHQTKKNISSHPALAKNKKIIDQEKPQPDWLRSSSQVDYFIPDRRKNLSGNVDELSASIDKETIIIPKQNEVLKDADIFKYKKNENKPTDDFQKADKVDLIGFLFFLFEFFCLMGSLFFSPFVFPLIKLLFLIGFVIGLIGAYVTYKGVFGKGNMPSKYNKAEFVLVILMGLMLLYNLFKYKVY